MRISDLLVREPFGRVLEKTLEHYWSNYYQKPVSVHWVDHSKKAGYKEFHGSQYWLVNQYVNAIFTPDADPTVFTPIRREFSRSIVWWRRPLQKAYVWCSTTSLTSPVFAQMRLWVNPRIPDAATQLIVPGNRKIRILDHRKQTSTAILKNGFLPEFLGREIKSRELAYRHGVPVPVLEEFDLQNGWFRENYVIGTPINRLENKIRQNQALEKVKNSLINLYQQTAEYLPLNKYCDELRQAILGTFKRNPQYPSETKNAVVHIMEKSLQRISDLQSNEFIQITFNHGDFQPANILVEGRQVWLIDWEYAAHRQFGYDALVYFLGSRHSKGLGKRIRDFVEFGFENQDNLVVIPIWNSSRYHRLIAVYVFLLEEIVFRLEDSCNPAFNSVGANLKHFIDEIQTWFEALES